MRKKNKKQWQLRYCQNLKKIEGKIAVLRANKAENRVYYEYMDEPKNPLANEVEQLKQVVADLEAAIAAILGGV